MPLIKATRTKAKLRIGIAGASGSGKTYSALKLAAGLTSWDKIALIDTENGSGHLYADLGEYSVFELKAPYTPANYRKAIKECEEAGMEVIIIDSVTHVWKGEGGLLEYNANLGGKFQDWAKTNPLYQQFLQAILQSPAHIITTVRKKTAYAMIQEGGKSKVEKMGLDDEIRDGFEYELTIAFNLNHAHLAEASKDRTGLFVDQPETRIDENTGKALLDWSQQGSEKIPPTPDQIKYLHTLLSKKGADKSELLAYYEVESSKDLSYQQIEEAIKILQKRPDKDEADTVAEEVMENLK